MFGLGPLEVVVIGAIAVMLYGRRLPEVGRTVGRTIGELRRHWSTLASELDMAAHIEGRSPRPSSRSSRRSGDDADAALAAAPRFDPPPGD